MACPSCVTGGLHEGTPQGYEEEIFGLSCYVTSSSIIQANSKDTTPQTSRVSESTTTEGHIVILTDALGYEFKNTRLLADRYAQRCNAKIYIPEFMDGHGMDPSLFESMDILLGHVPSAGLLAKAGAVAHVISGFVPFLWFNRQAVCEPRIKTWMSRLRDQIDHQPGQDTKTPAKLGAAGFCWGGKYTFLLSHRPSASTSSSPILDFGYTAHPSNLVLPVDAAKVASPLCVVVGEKDPLLPISQIEIMKSALEDEQKRDLNCRIHVFAEAGHGFAVRARPGDEQAVKHGKDAEDLAVEWFNRYLGDEADTKKEG